MTRRARPALPQLSSIWPALAGALLVVTAGTATTATLVVAEPVANYDTPQTRAADLGLPQPAGRADATHPNCAADVQGQFPPACFPALNDADDYIAGRTRRPATDITLAGFGGTSASTTGSPAIGRTCTGSGCGGTTTTWYSTTGANCTHAYPYNDYFKENVSTFYYAKNYVVGVGALNCNRLILYRDATQGGSGALDCGATTATCGSGAASYQSISWHNG